MTVSYCPQIRPVDWGEPEPSRSEWLRRKSRTVEQAKLELIDELVSKALAVAPEVALEQRFREQADKWDAETRHLSSPTQKIAHQSHQAILGMGPDVVPLLLRDLVQNRREWFWALSYLTQENPIRREDAGKMDRMIAAWVNWGRQRGLL